MAAIAGFAPGGDAVPIAHHGLERVVDAKGRVAEILHLLQHRVRQAGDIGVTAQKQHRQTVGMGKRGAGQQVGSPRTSTCGAEHKALAQPLLGITGGSKAHALFILAPVQRQLVAHCVQRLAQTGDIAMAKDAKAATAQAHFLTVDHDELVGQIADDGLCGGQANGLIGHVRISLWRLSPHDYAAIPACHLYGPRILQLQPVANIK